MGIDKNLVQGSMALMLLRLLETKDMYGYEISVAAFSGKQGICDFL